MIRHLYPILFAFALWWASTGAIIFLYRLPRRTYGLSFAGATLVLLASLYGLWLLRDDTGLAAAYLGFTCGTLIWGWQLTGFYMGFVTGPALEPPPRDYTGAARFARAVRGSLHHELAALAGLVAAFALSWGAQNQLGAWTYLLLWLMHLASKLNIFFGARNFNEGLLPAHLRFLAEFFRDRPMNLLFPVTITVSVVAATLLIRRAVDPAASDFDAVSGTFLGFMALLGLLEIWLLMVPPAGVAWGEERVSG
jgi:putative photosynthetic complex assembly protein 2